MSTALPDTTLRHLGVRQAACRIAKTIETPPTAQPLPLLRTVDLRR